MLSVILVAYGLVVPTAPLALHGACMSPVATRAAAPVAVVPPTRSVPVVVGFAAIVGWIREVLRGESSAARFANMRWSEAMDDAEGEACIVIGEEEEEDG